MKCVLCARRNRQTEAEAHVCAPCAGWLQREVAEILRLAADAAAWVSPGSTGSSGARSVPGSRPPLRVDALDPELTPVPQPGQPSEVWPTVLEVCEAWERMTREMRGLAPYGPASAARARGMALERARTALGGTDGAGGVNDTSVTLTGCVAFLGRQVAWMTTESDFPVDDFADEIGACVRVLRRWDSTTEERGTMVRCPTVTDAGECGYRLSYRDMDEPVTCRRCGQTRDAATLALIAMSDGREVWLDPEAAAKWLCVSEPTLRRMARRGEIQRSHGRYRMPASTAV